MISIISTGDQQNLMDDPDMKQYIQFMGKAVKYMEHPEFKAANGFLSSAVKDHLVCPLLATMKYEFGKTSLSLMLTEIAKYMTRTKENSTVYEVMGFFAFAMSAKLVDLPEMGFTSDMVTTRPGGKALSWKQHCNQVAASYMKNKAKYEASAYQHNILWKQAGELTATVRAVKEKRPSERTGDEKNLLKMVENMDKMWSAPRPMPGFEP
eukprot:5406499-Pleurochrysis_carterae.AAC.1